MITLIGEQSRHSESRYRRWREYQGDMQKLVRDVLYRLQVVGAQWLERNEEHFDLPVAPGPEGIGTDQADRETAKSVAGWVYQSLRVDR